MLNAASDVVTRTAAPTDTGAGKRLDGGQLLAKAKEFESILLGQWLQATESSFGQAPGSEDGDAASDQVRGFAVQQLAKGISDIGGIGIAQIVANALSKTAAVSGAEGSIALGPASTRILSGKTKQAVNPTQ